MQCTVLPVVENTVGLSWGLFVWQSDGGVAKCTCTVLPQLSMGALCGKVKRTVYGPSSVEYGGFVWQSKAYRVRSFLS